MFLLVIIGLPSNGLSGFRLFRRENCAGLAGRIVDDHDLAGLKLTMDAGDLILNGCFGLAVDRAMAGDKFFDEGVESVRA